MILQGRRREDMPDRLQGIPSKIKPGDYWRARVQEGKQEHWEWWIAAPDNENKEKFHLGRLGKHTVVEHEDGTISVMIDQARDGHMNSILISQGNKQLFHGWIKRGHWSESWEELNREIPD
jgi:hypothetical protein